MAETLAGLQQECERIGRRVTDAHLPLKMYGKSCDVELQLYGDNGNYWVEIRSSIDLDEKIAIIMQMFEEGSNDSIAMTVANKIKQETVDKACEWLSNNLHLVRDWSGTPAQNYRELVIMFRKAMQ